MNKTKFMHFQTINTPIKQHQVVTNSKIKPGKETDSDGAKVVNGEEDRFGMGWSEKLSPRR